jgi:hypothetical protein
MTGVEMSRRRWEVSAFYRTQGRALTAGRLRSRLGRTYRSSCVARDELLVRAKVRAHSSEEAVAMVSAGVLSASFHLASHLEHAHVWPVTHLPFARRRRAALLIGPDVGGSDGDDGTAGVREPRRPLGSPPALSVAREESRENPTGSDETGAWAAA